MLLVTWLMRDPDTGELAIVSTSSMGDVSDDDAIFIAEERISLGGPVSGYQLHRDDNSILRTHLPPEK